MPLTEEALAAATLPHGPAPVDGSQAVTIAYVHQNTDAHSWHRSLVELLGWDLAHAGHVLEGGWLAMRYGADGLVAARNKAIGEFLAEKSSPWLLWLDTDMGFAPDTLDRLLAAADPESRPIVGALCFAQRERIPDGMGGWRCTANPTIFDWTEADGAQGFLARSTYPVGALVRCAGTGSACILVHRSVFERIAEAHGPVWYDRVPNPKAGHLISEDLSFCLRAGALGIPVHVHAGVRTSHFKEFWLTEQDYWERAVAPPATEEVAVLVPVLHRPEHAVPFMASLRASTGLARAYAVCDPEDSEALAAWDAAGATVLADPAIRDRPGTFAEKVNFGYAKTGEPWLFLVGSDVRFHPAWLDHAAAIAGDRYHVVGTNDLGNPRVTSGEHATHLLVRRSYVDEVGASWDGPGVVCHEGYAHWFCNPPEAPIWMGDLSFKALGEVRIGDEVVGWERFTPEGSSFSLNRLCRSQVTQITNRTSPLVKVTMESGRTFRCTPDHRWYNACWTPAANRRWADYPQWVTPRVGRGLLHIVDEPPAVPPELERTAGWLGGIYDGEGSWIQIAQCPKHNPEVYAAIQAALNKLDIPHTAGIETAGGHFITLRGGRQGYLDFLLRCQPVKRRAIVEKIIGGRRFGHRDDIVSVEPCGEGEVLSMTTTTGNYVAWGYASRNCDDEIVTAAKQRGAWAMALGAMVEHLHPAWGKAPMDAVYRLGEQHAGADRQRFGERLAALAPELAR
jgi:hypothetical protein